MARRQATDASERRTAHIGFDLAPTEKAELVARAKRTGETPSEMYRRLLLTGAGREPPTPRDTKAIRELTVALVRIGTNLNQMAYRANETRRVPEERYLREMGERIEAALEKVSAL